MGNWKIIPEKLVSRKLNWFLHRASLWLRVGAFLWLRVRVYLWLRVKAEIVSQCILFEEIPFFWEILFSRKFFSIMPDYARLCPIMPHYARLCPIMPHFSINWIKMSFPETRKTHQINPVIDCGFVSMFVTICHFFMVLSTTVHVLEKLPNFYFCNSMSLLDCIFDKCYYNFRILEK